MRSNKAIRIFPLILFISLAKTEISKDGRVVLVSPVLAPYRNARVQTNETAKDFPLLMLLASDKNSTEVDEAKSNVSSEMHQPIYVQKLEDQKDRLRRRRRQSRIYFVHKY